MSDILDLYVLIYRHVGFHKTLQQKENEVLIYLWSMFHFYATWKRQKTKGFLKFSRGTEMEYYPEMG